MIKFLSLSDEQLIAFIGAGGAKEERALRQILKENGSMIKNFVIHHGGSQEAGEEVLYDALTSMVFNIRSGKFQGQSKLSTYLFSIAKRRWYKAFSKEINMSKKHQAWGDELGHHHAYEDDLLQTSDRKAFLDNILSLLGKGCKEVLLLWSGHFNMDEIAQKMGFKNAQIAMNKKSKCFRQLLQKIEEQPELKALLSELHFG